MLNLISTSTTIRTMSVVVLVSATCGIASTQATEISHSNTSAYFTEREDTFNELKNVVNNSLFLSETSPTLIYCSELDLDKSKKAIQSEILAFKKLLGCWDGEDAEPIAIGAIDSANLFLESYHGNLMFEAFPDPDGSVGLQADFAEGRIILSFDDTGEVAYLIRKNKAVHRGHNATHETINSLFSSLL